MMARKLMAVSLNLFILLLFVGLAVLIAGAIGSTFNRGSPSAAAGPAPHSINAGIFSPGLIPPPPKAGNPR